MKNVIFGAVALTMVSGAAHAACSDIPNPTRFNPTELSDYQECWLDTFQSDEVAGVLGSIAWIKLDGEYFSASLSEIRKNPGSYSEKFIAAIQSELVAYTVEEMTTEVTAAEELIVALEKVETLTGRIDILVAANADLDEIIADLRADLTAAESDVADAMAQIEELIADRDLMTAHGERAVGFLSQIYNHVQHGLLGAGNHNYAPSADGTWISHDDYRYIYDGIQTMKDRISALTAPVSLANSSIDIASGSAGWSGDTMHGYEVSIAGTEFVMDISVELANALNGLSTELQDEIKAAIEGAYEEGYADGYTTGYQDGWNARGNL